MKFTLSSSLLFLLFSLSILAPSVTALPPCGLEPIKRENLVACPPTTSPPVNCQVGSWGSWGSCVGDVCGEGTQTRTRPIIISPCCGGSACPSRTQSRSCTPSTTSTLPPIQKKALDLDCDVDCLWSSWSQWGSCSATCAGGTQLRSRIVTRLPQGSGSPCQPPSKQTRTCNTQVCDVNCEVGSWSSWSSCNPTCGNGSQSRGRSITQQRAGNGAICPPLLDLRSCSNGVCPVDCVIGGWTQWSSCSVSCGGGSRSRSRSNTPPVGTGAACPSSSQTANCNTHLCDVNCVQSSWSSFSQCSEPCGPGQKTRSRSITTQPVANGTPCGSSSETETCNLGPCATECEVSAWSGWGSCNADCGGGSQSRSRTVVDSHGFSCPSLSEQRSCNNHLCDIDCQVSAWSSYGGCSVSCGGGSQTRTRTVTTAQQADGAACPNLSENRACNTQVCDVDCVVGSWEPFSSCTVECGGGERTRTRGVVTQPVGNGASCPALSETNSCNNHVCPVNCEVSEWTASECTEPCGSGTITRTREVTVPHAGTGSECPSPLSETVDCNTQPCVTSCEVTTWSEWSDCSTPCGDGTSGRFREVTQEPENADPCPPLTSVVSCNLGVCPADCEVSEWTEWTDCSLSCGGGSRDRERSVTSPTAGTGAECPPLQDSETCNDFVCDVNCEQSVWSEWNSCSGTCDAGTQSRSRATLTPAGGDGTPCGPATEDQTCSLPPCEGEPEPQDCIVNDWGEWSPCDCDTAGSERSRTLTMAANGGEPCDPQTPLSELKECPVCPPVDCVPGEWSEWSSCDCSTVTPISRTRMIAPAQYGGQCVDDSTEETMDCPLDCPAPSPPPDAMPSSPPPPPVPESPSASPQSPAPSTPSPPPSPSHSPQPPVSSSPPSPSPLPSASPISEVPSATPEIPPSPSPSPHFPSPSSEVTPLSPAPSPSQSPSPQSPSEEPVDCVAGGWSFWSKCICGGSPDRTRSRTITPESNGGICDLHASETKPCQIDCEVVDCSLGPWSFWSACDCDGAAMKDRYRELTPAKNGGLSCESAELEQTEDCLSSCLEKIDCSLKPWGEWSECECGSNIITRTRVRVKALHGGAECSQGDATASLEHHDTCVPNCPVENPCLAVGLTADCEVIEDDDSSSPIVGSPDAVGATTSEPAGEPTHTYEDDVPAIIQDSGLVLPDRTTIKQTHVVFESSHVTVEGSIDMGKAAVGINENSHMSVDGIL
eukprot:TRINITY_DN1263_c0_g1_i2.p1 TRINITY_DN1263_c0_g1~~TRINITY_DN1263_c0_g1_i2.p1  ORF type:complete len:1221 (-),score=195.21 TRINITY_DN1263_c0_g1_i2:230-3892(-)